jgi:AcrR family transcriptional regulator
MGSPSDRTVAPRRTQAERRDRTERLLLSAAAEIVGEHGVRAVTTAAVGARAGYSRGIVNHHFGSRDALMVRLAAFAQGRFRPDPRVLRGRDHVTAVVDAYLAFSQAHPDDGRVFLRLWASAIGGEEPALRDAFVERDAQFCDVFAEALTDGIEDGTVRPDIDPRAAAVALVGLLRGIAMQWQVAPDEASAAAVRANARALVDAGLAPGGAGGVGEGAER